MREAAADASVEVAIVVLPLWDDSALCPVPRNPIVGLLPSASESVAPQPLWFYTPKTHPAISQSRCGLTAVEVLLCEPESPGGTSPEPTTPRTELKAHAESPRSSSFLTASATNPRPPLSGHT